MFVRTKQQANGKVSILIVENVRESGKVCQKLEKSKKPESLISNYGYKKYLTVDGEVQVRVNEE